MIKNSLGKNNLSLNPRKTRILDNTVLQVTGDHSWINSMISGYSYCDGYGKYKFNFNIIGTCSYGANQIQIATVTGIVFKSGTWQAIQAVVDGSSLWAGGQANSNSGNLYAQAPIGTTRWQLSGDVLLESKPTWFDANLDLL
jgi:hypothetical protein